MLEDVVVAAVATQQYNNRSNGNKNNVGKEGLCAVGTLQSQDQGKTAYQDVEEKGR